jgi:serine/threonine protein kinase
MAAAGYEVTSLVRTVHSTIGLIEKAVTLIKDYGQSDRDAQLLLPHLESDADSLKTALRVLTDMGNAADGVVLNEGEQRLHSDIESYLILLEKRLRQRTERLAVGAQADPGRSASLGARTTPAPWSRQDLRQLERNLNDWIRRFQLVYSVIDAAMTSSTLRPGTPAKRVNAHINIFSQLTLEDVSAEELYRDVSNVHAGGKPSRRMCATYRSKANEELPVIAEYIYKPYLSDLDPAEISTIGTAVYSLAKVLHRSDPDQTQILKCDGYFHDEKTFRFGLIYEIPPNLSCHCDANGAKRVLSLSDLFTQIPRFSMSHRFRFACDVAKAVLYVHLAGWVHKSIRPNNVIILEDPSLDRVRQFPYSLPRPFLAGFEYARSLKTASNRSSDAEWQLNIYRHPRRQFLERNSMYNMSHDVYSLGVVLLELCLWGSAGFVPFQMREEPFKGKRGEQMKEVLLSLARGTFTESSKEKGVAVQMGDRYGELVRYCLEIDHKEELPSAAFVQEIWLRLDEMRSAL